MDFTACRKEESPCIKEKVPSPGVFPHLESVSAERTVGFTTAQGSTSVGSVTAGSLSPRPPLAPGTSLVHGELGPARHTGADTLGGRPIDKMVFGSLIVCDIS